MEKGLALFGPFAKGKQVQRSKGGNCVIYTRVSTKEQSDNNQSLDIQRKACEAFATKSGYPILGYFGGTYESAKTDERRHFNNMLSFIKKSRDKVSYIIVYSVDRFSRSGANAIYIAEQLRKQGIGILAVTQPTDTATASGSLQQNIQFIFSEYDNQLRREKCMAGVREKLMQGIWCGTPPAGYDIVRREGKKQFLLNDKGRLIAKAFTWKAQGLSIVDIRERLVAQGLPICHQRVSDILRNPFYCGLIAHNALNGEVVEGVQERAISRELFLQVNGILAQNKHGYRIQPENDDAPLKRFIKCDNCGSYLRAYKAYKNQQYYYKCNKVGCNCNKRADALHEKFRSILGDFTVTLNADMKYLIARQMRATYLQLTKEQQDVTASLEAQLKEVEKKLGRLEERFIEEDINRDMYAKYSERYKAERTEIMAQIQKSGAGVSNLDKCIDKAIDYAAKLTPLWEHSDYAGKQMLQNLVFPEGMYYDRKNDGCRTPKVNGVFHYISTLAGVAGHEKSGSTVDENNSAALVELAGVEPASKHILHKLSTCLFVHCLSGYNRGTTNQSYP
jgi:site-specific DNA recombinase